MAGLTNPRVLLGLAAIAIALIAIFALSRPAADPSATSPNASSSGGALALLSPGPLPEMAAGNKDAKVTIVEYASMSCPACAQFHKTVYPEIKKKYVDTGKVYFIFREFPLNTAAMAGSMLARCVPADKSKDLVAELFNRQSEWLIDGDPVEKLFGVVKQAGFTRAAFDKCLDDKVLYEKIMTIKQRGDKQFGVTATPSFFINGVKHKGAPNQAALEGAIEAALK